MQHPLKSLLAESKTKQVLTELKQLQLADKDQEHLIIQLSARFTELERQQAAGTLSQGDINLERNKINAALLSVIDNLPDNAEPTPQQPVSNTKKTTIQNAVKIYNIGHIDNANFS